ncbi:hypothetical protein [Paraburkholderia ferrariae]|uniref:hypothetical protein n=1 Tax=Paraburkholderia ferrariae TaxID=386056 RepID=UPI0005A8C71F|nr:hypothetical protein [Paraburkholderia ferrariae]
MRIRPRDASQASAFALAFAVVLATISLAACGPDAGPDAGGSTASVPTPAQANAAPTSAAPLLPQTAYAAAPSAGNGANGIASGTSSSGDTAPPAAAVQSAQASLAADSQQVAPVLSYAPGDADDPGNPANDSRRTATTSQ